MPHGRALALVLLLSACRGPGATAAPPPTNRTAAVADIPAELLTRAPAALRSVVVRDDVAYLFLAFVDHPGEEPATIPMPPCWYEGEARCANVQAAPAAVAARFPDLPRTLMVVGEDGPCVAAVGAVQLVNTYGCEPSGMVAAPLTGCPVDVAPVGRVDGGFDPALRWHPAPLGDDAPLFADPAALPDPVHRRLVTGWLADIASEGAPHEGRTAHTSLDVGAEALEAFVARYLVGDSADECEWSVGERAEVGLRRGETLAPLAVPSTWQGALSWRGRVVGVISGAPRDVVLHAVGPDGAARGVYEDTVWWDNEECTQDRGLGIEYPCGP